MKGNNEIYLNDSTMREAIQQYLEREWKRDDFEVMKVETSTVNYSSTYKVQIGMIEEEGK